jgi:HSP20 family molecular chaperone IbpA
MALMTRPLSEIREQMEHLYGETTDDFGLPLTLPLQIADRNKRALCQTWSPAIEIYETASAFKVRVEVPGINKQNLSFEILGNRLVILGSYPSQPQGKQPQYAHCSEFRYGRFMRQIELPAAVAGVKATQKLLNGVLEINLPKVKASRKPRPPKTRF